MTQLPVLYGMPGSLYTGKVRSYLRKQRIAFDERPAGDPRFREEIVPQIGRWIIPVLQMPDGTLLQDGAAIIDHFEANAAVLGLTQRPRALPQDAVLAVLAHVFELFGGEGLLRPAMHYRWNFDADNLDFLRADFCAGLAPGASADEQRAIFDLASKRMRQATLAFGVTPQTIATIEHSYADFLGRLDHHLAHTPYLLGDTPTLADYGLIAPLYAHLARDPHPASLMKRTAPRVWRWVERMNSPDPEIGEYLGRSSHGLDIGRDGETLPSLENLLAFVAQDYLPEIAAYVSFTDAWLASRPDIPAGSNGMPKPGDRQIGITQLIWRGQAIDVMVMPYRLYLLQRVQDAAERLDTTDTARLQALLERSGLTSLLTLKCRRRVLRQGHLEVWGPSNPLGDA